MLRTLARLAAFSCIATCSVAAEPFTGLPCEGCEAIFDRPLASIKQRVARIAPHDAPGQPLVVRGVVTDSSGRPRSGIVLYAYQTDATGRYQTDPQAPSAAGRRHGRYRSWALSDDGGNYEFITVRPGGYPGSDLPQHIHIHVLEPGCSTYYLEDITFDDDPRMTATKRREFSNDRGGSGFSHPLQINGTALVTRNVILGHKIPGYKSCD